MKINRILFFALAVLLTSCHSREIGFIYSPAEPRAGQTVTFTNTSETGDTWSWNFGDGTSSVSKSPSKVYKAAGDYVVTLKVDDRKSMVYTTTIHVLDTLPSITVSDTLPKVYKSVKLGISCYNPNKLALTYQWLFSPNAVVDTGYSATDSCVSVYFRKQADAESISVVVTMGSKIDTVSRVLKVSDVLVPSIIISSTDQSLKQYRLFEQGLEHKTDIDNSQKVNHLLAYNNLIYIFADNGILTTDNLGRSEYIIESSKPIIAGTILRDSIFWKSTKDKLHALPLGVKAESSAENEVRDWRALDSQIINSVFMTADGNNLCFAGNGCVVGSDGYYSEYSDMRALAVDRINGKFYFVDSGLLIVANIGGDLDDISVLAECDGHNLAISHELDCLFYSDKGKLYSLPLIHTVRNIIAGQPKELCADVVNFCLDKNLR